MLAPSEAGVSKTFGSGTGASGARGRSVVWRVFGSIGVVAATLVVVGLVETVLAHPPAAILLYLVPITFAASRWGRVPAVAAVVAAVLGHDFFFVEPRGTLTVTSANDALGLALLLFTALVTAQLADSARRAVDTAREAAQARRSDELKSALLRAVSHDLRSPLAAIKANVSGLRHAGDRYTEQERVEALAAVESEADRLDHLVGNLLDLSRIEGGALHPRRRPEDLAELLSGVVARLGPSLAGRSVLVDAPEDMPSVSCDYRQIDQVISNLLENAAHHTPPGTPIELRARVAGGVARIEVLDRGPGVAAIDRERVFRPFERATSARRGSGLGLAIARGLAEAHGGRLWVEGRPGDGAAFVCTLPVEP